MKNRKVVAFILTLSLVFSPFSVSFAATETTAASTNPVTFSDVTGHWGAAAISKWSGYGIINGYEGLFRPDDPITRGEMAVILDNMMDYQEVAANTFTDLQAGQFYTDAVLKANAAGIVKGDGVTVRPTDKITKEEAAIMMSRAFAVTEANSTKAFLDASAVSDWAKRAVFGMEVKGYVSGFGGYFYPKANITRAEAVTMINNIVKAYYTAAGTYTENVAGTAIIKVADVILKGVTVSENLIIAEGVAQGDATLDSVTIKGETVIRGGGENSVHITGNSVITKVTIEKVGDKLRVVIDDGITVTNVEVAAGEEIIITGSVGTVELNAPGAIVYANAAEINSATITGDNSTIVVGAQSTLNNVTVSNTANNTSIRTETGAVVGAITASSEVEVSGTGTVTKVTLQAGADGSSVTTPNTATTVPTGVSGVTGGGGTAIPAGSTGTNSSTGTTATVTTSTPPTGGGGGGGSSTIAVTEVTVTSPAVTISTDNGTLQMSAVIAPTNASNQNVTWSVTNGTGYATINSSGLLTAVSNGTVTVSAVSVSNGTVSGSLGITLSNQVLDAITTAGATRTSPAVGEPGANATVSASVNYTHTSTVWSGKAGANYAVGETPVAIITLEAKTGYTFTGLTAGSVTVAGGTVTYGGGQGVVSGGAFVVFTVTYPQLTATIPSATATCTSPAIGEAGASAAVSGSANYTLASTIWTGRAGGTFAAGETPAAIVTLTAKAGYGFTGLLASNITVAGGTVSYGAGQGVTAGGVSVVFTVTYPQLVGTLSAATVTVTTPALGVTPPNAAAVEAATSNANYTVSNITWNGALTSTGKFKADAAYSATIVLTSKNFYKFQAGAFTPTVASALSVGTTTTVGTTVGNTASFTATFTSTGALTVSSISVTAQPTQLSYFDGTALSLNGLVITETNNDSSTAAALFPSGVNANYSASPANGTTLTTAYNGTPVAITHIATGKIATTTALAVASTVSALSGADVSLTAGSIVFDYDFTGTSGAITYADALVGPYYLDTAASTVTLKNSSFSSSAVSVSALGLAADGTVSYAAISNIQSVFTGLNFIPTQVAISLKGATAINSGSNQWTYNIDINLDPAEITLLTPTVLTSAAVSVTAPAVGVALEDAAVAPGSHYTHISTVWTGKAGATYAAGETPSAIISLAAETDYTFTGLAAGNITVAGGTVSFGSGQGVTTSGLAVTFTVSYPQLVNTITTASVTVTAPVLGATPESTGTIEAATSNIAFSVSNVTWNEAMTSTGKFKADQAYSASIVLTAKSGYAFTGAGVTAVVAGSASVGTVTTSGSGIGNSVSFTASYTTTAALTVSSITVTTQPTKMSYMESTDDVLDLSGLEILETYNDTSTGSATFAGGTNINYSASPANGTTLTTSYNSTPVAITHIVTGKVATTGALTVLSTVSAISGTNVTLTAGSIVFDYDFTGTSGAISYAQGQLAPYYLNPVASTVTLTNGISSTSAVSLSALGISDDGVVSYGAITSLGAVFTGLDFIPSQVVINLVGATSVNSGANQWTYNIGVNLDMDEIGLLTPDVIATATVTCTSPAIGEIGSSAVVDPSENYSVNSTTWIGQAAGFGNPFAAGDTPSATIYLEAETDCIFNAGLTAGGITVSGGSVSFVGDQGVTAGGMILNFTVTYPQLIDTIATVGAICTQPGVGTAAPYFEDAVPVDGSKYSHIATAWSGDSGALYAVGDIPTAVVTLAAITGYTFEGITEAGISVSGGVVSFDTGQGVTSAGGLLAFTVTYPQLKGATLSNVIIAGTVSNPITDSAIDIEIIGDTLDSTIAASTDLSAWFTNLPAGLSAEAQAEATSGSTSVAITISGTPTIAANEAIEVTIPGSSLSGAAEITANFNTDARFAIASAAVGNVTISGTVGNAITSKDVAITLAGDTISTTITAGDNLASWITNLPTGLTAVAQADAAIGATSVTITVSGTPVVAAGQAITLVVPASALTNGIPVEVTANADAKYVIAGTATVGDVLINGVKDTSITSKDVVITLTGDTFKTISTGTNLAGWIINIPNGLTAVAKSDVSDGSTVATITVSDAPTVVLNQALSITIPAINLSSGVNLTASSNANAKFIISEATLGNVVVEGWSGNAITDTDVVITLTNDTFKAISTGTDLASWIANLPAGLSAAAKADVLNGDTSATITVSGTPTEGNLQAIAITIPSASLNGGLDTTASSNANAEFAIAGATISDVTIIGSVGSGTLSPSEYEVVITLIGDSFNTIIPMMTDDLTTWINLPAGLDAYAAADVFMGATSITLSVGNIPLATSSAQIVVTIPASVLTGGQNITTTINMNALYNITP